jgi:hypothetical protein
MASGLRNPACQTRAAHRSVGGGPSRGIVKARYMGRAALGAGAAPPPEPSYVKHHEPEQTGERNCIEQGATDFVSGVVPFPTICCGGDNGHDCSQPEESGCKPKEGLPNPL